MLDYEIYKTKTNIFSYLYFDACYYLASHTHTVDIGYQGQILKQKKTIALDVYQKFKDEKMAFKLKMSKRIETNIERRTKLFKIFKKHYSQLFHYISNTKKEDYQNFMGLLYSDEIVVTPKTFEIIRRKTNAVESEKDLYPPEILALTLLSRRIRTVGNVGINQLRNIILAK